MHITNIHQKISIQTSKENEIKKTQLLQTEKKDISLEVEGQEQATNLQALPIVHTVVEKETIIATKTSEQEEEVEENNEEALDYTKNHMTEEDYEELEKEGYSIEEYEIERLEKALIRRKENKEFIKDTIETSVENRKEFREDIEKIVINNKISDPMAKEIAQKLVDANLPVTQANVEAILSAMKLSDVVSNISENAMATLIKKELPLTLENIYHSQYSAIKENSLGDANSRG